MPWFFMHELKPWPKVKHRSRISSKYSYHHSYHLNPPFMKTLFDKDIFLVAKIYIEHMFLAIYCKGYFSSKCSIWMTNICRDRNECECSCGLLTWLTENLGPQLMPVRGVSVHRSCFIWLIYLGRWTVPEPWQFLSQVTLIYQSLAQCMQYQT